MTKEQREQAEAWSKHLEWLYEGKLEAEIAALLRAGIAASDECERLRVQVEELDAECQEWDRLQRDTQDERDAAWLAAWDAEWRAQFVLPLHKAGLYLNHNEHLCYYETAEKWIEDREAHDIADDWSSPDARQRCIDTNEVWVLHWYPQNPVGFFCIAGPTLEEVLAAARVANR